MKRSTAVEIISILFMILFLYTGISKLMEYPVFKEQIAVSPLLSPVAPVIAGGLPFLEFLLVVLLMIPRWRLKGLYASTALMMAFTVYIIAMMIFADHLPCSCGGVLAGLSWGQHIIFNSGFIGLGVIGIILDRKHHKASDVWNTAGKQPNLDV